MRRGKSPTSGSNNGDGLGTWEKRDRKLDILGMGIVKKKGALGDLLHVWRSGLGVERGKEELGGEKRRARRIQIKWEAR